MTTIFFACDSLSQQVEPGSAGWFCCYHLGPLIQPKSSRNSPGASGQKMVSLTCLVVMLAVGWAFLFPAGLAQAYLCGNSSLLRGQV